MRIILMVLSLQTALSASPEIWTAIDIGTGKIKMQVARMGKEKIESLYCQSEKIPLPLDSLLDKEGMITKIGREKIEELVLSFKLLGESYGAAKCSAVATELFRKAPNGLNIAEKIGQSLGMEIKIVSPKEEGVLSFLTLLQERNLNPDKIVVLDIGSGSFQITCRVGREFRVYSAPFGRLPFYELAKHNELSPLKESLQKIDPSICEKIRSCEKRVIGTGAHPKQIILMKTSYGKDDLKKAFEAEIKEEIDHTDLLLLQTILESLPIEQIDYYPSRAGLTSGLLLDARDRNDDCLARGDRFSRPGS